MKPVVRLLGVLGLCLVVSQGHRDAAADTLEAPTTPAQVGAAAGEAAGKRAGNAAGEVAAKAAISQAAPERAGYKESGFPKVLHVAADASAAEPVSSDLLEQNAGAINYFRQFDVDGNGMWNPAEWKAAIDRAVLLRYLPASFDRDAQWNSMTKSDTGEVSMADYLLWAAKTPAHQPPKKYMSIPPKYTITKAYKFANCEEAFGVYDANHDGVWSLEEFSKAVNGRVADDHIVDKWHTLPKLGAGDDKLDLSTWVDFCVALTGLPAGGARVPRKRACVPNPCKEAGTVCMEDPQICLVGFDCPQYRCVKTNTNLASPFARAYDNCTRTFAKFDLNKDNRLTEEEFRSGVHFNRGVNFPGKKRFSVVKTWAHFHKDADNMVSLYEFVHFCVAVAEEGRDDGGVVKSECWDVFNQFDTDSSVDLSEAEFTKGMLRAKQHGHVPVTMKIAEVWKALPKNDLRVSAGPFIKWCMDVSRGIDGVTAARSILTPAGGTTLPPTVASQISNTTLTNETLIIGWRNGTITQSWMNGSVIAWNPDGTVAQYALPVYGVQPKNYQPLPTTPLISNEITGVQIRTKRSRRWQQLSKTTGVPVPPIPVKAKFSSGVNPLQLLSKSTRAAIGGLVASLGLTAALGGGSPSTYVESPTSPAFCVKEFKLGDTNKDGFMRIDEFHSICEDLYPADACAQFPALFFKADSNRNQKLEPAEFNQMCQAAPKFEASQITMVEARKKAVDDATAAGKDAGTTAGEAAGRAAGERAAAVGTLPYHSFRSIPAVPLAVPVLSDEELSHDLEKIDPRDLDE